MSDQHYTTTIVVDQTPHAAFAAINNVRGWWSGDIEGVTDQLGAEFTYRVPDVHYCKMKIAQFIPGKKVGWHVLGRERWLSAEEFATLDGACPEAWWAVIATLVYTGLRVGEAQGLVGEDVHLAERRISIHEGNRHVKTPSSVRDVPIPEPLAEVLGEHFVRHPAGPADPVFPFPLSDYRALRRVWRRVCRAAGVHGATLHDCRHTFGVHCAQAGVPIVRLQKLLGHATPAMALRYMKHAPEAYFAEDAAKVAASLTGALDREREARAASARAGLKRA